MVRTKQGGEDDQNMCRDEGESYDVPNLKGMSFEMEISTLATWKVGSSVAEWTLGSFDKGRKVAATPKL